MRQGEGLYGDFSDLEYLPVLKDAPVQTISYAIAKGLPRQGSGKNRSRALTEKDLQATGVVTMLMSQQDSIQRVWIDPDLVQSSAQLPGTEPCIHEHGRVLSLDHGSVSSTPAAQNCHLPNAVRVKIQTIHRQIEITIAPSFFEDSPPPSFYDSLLNDRLVSIGDLIQPLLS